MDHGVGRHVASHLWGVIALPNSGPAMGKLMQEMEMITVTTTQPK